jgi:hypothetical protein
MEVSDFDTCKLKVTIRLAVTGQEMFVYPDEDHSVEWVLRQALDNKDWFKDLAIRPKHGILWKVPPGAEPYVLRKMKTKINDVFDGYEEEDRVLHLVTGQHAP